MTQNAFHSGDGEEERSLNKERLGSAKVARESLETGDNRELEGYI